MFHHYWKVTMNSTNNFFHGQRDIHPLWVMTCKAKLIQVSSWNWTKLYCLRLKCVWIWVIILGIAVAAKHTERVSPTIMPPAGCIQPARDKLQAAPSPKKRKREGEHYTFEREYMTRKTLVLLMTYANSFPSFLLWRMPSCFKTNQQSNLL